MQRQQSHAVQNLVLRGGRPGLERGVNRNSSRARCGGERVPIQVSIMSSGSKVFVWCVPHLRRVAALQLLLQSMRSKRTHSYSCRSGRDVSEAVTWRSKATAPENPRQAAGRLMLNAILRSLLEGFFQANQPFRRSCSDVFPSAYPLPTHCSAAQSAPRQFRRRRRRRVGCSRRCGFKDRETHTYIGALQNLVAKNEI